MNQKIAKNGGQLFQVVSIYKDGTIVKSDTYPEAYANEYAETLKWNDKQAKREPWGGTNSKEFDKIFVKRV